MDIGDWTALVIALVAVYGAFVSTYNLVVARRQLRRQIPVTLSWGFLGVAAEPVTMFFLTAANPGDRSVTLTGCYLLLPNRKKLVMPHAQGSVTFPCDLHDGKNCMFWFPVREVVRALVSEGFRGEVAITAVFTDALDRTYQSHPFKGDVEQWARAA